MEPVSMTLSDI